MNKFLRALRWRWFTSPEQKAATLEALPAAELLVDAWYQRGRRARSRGEVRGILIDLIAASLAARSVQAVQAVQAAQVTRGPEERSNAGAPANR
jgi:hypothetical protein